MAGEAEKITPESEDMNASRAKVGVSQLSIPLAWNREQHFKSKGECRTFSMFVTIRCGEDMIDSKLVTGVDRTQTDVVFPESFVFNGIPDDFCIELDVFAARTDDLADGGGSIRQKITRSLGRKLGNATKQKLTVGEAALKVALPTAPESLGSTQFNLLARAQLALSDAGDEPKIHDLKIRAFADLCGPPLYGSIVSRLVVQPTSVLNPIADGVLTVVPADQQRVYQLVRATLQSGRLRCFINSQLSPSREDEQVLLEIMLNAGSQVGRTRADDELILTTATSALCGPARRFYIKTAEETIDAWHAALRKQISDCVAWGPFAYSSVMLTREPKKEPEGTFGRTAGKRFYDQVDINGTLPRFGTSSAFLMQLAASSCSRNNTPPASMLAQSPNLSNTAPARRGGPTRPSVMNVFADIPESPSENGVPPPRRSPLTATPRPYISKGVQASAPSPRAFARHETAREYTSVYDELPKTHSQVQTIYGTDSRRYAPAQSSVVGTKDRSDTNSPKAPPRLYDARPRAQTFTEKTKTIDENPYETQIPRATLDDQKYVISLTVGGDDDVQPKGTPPIPRVNIRNTPQETIRDYAPRTTYIGQPEEKKPLGTPPIPKPRTNLLHLRQTEYESRGNSCLTSLTSNLSNLSTPIQITRL